VVREIALLRRDAEREQRDRLALADDQIHAGLQRTLQEIDRADAALDRARQMAVIDGFRTEAKGLLNPFVYPKQQRP
jgi:hypothetical protein